MITCKKEFTGFPFAHRQPAHSGHCALIHGHNWSFVFVFGCKKLEPGTGFVVDFGKLDWLRSMLKDMFDHTLVLNTDDPYVDLFRGMSHIALREKALVNLMLVPNCSCEGLAQYLFELFDDQLRARTSERAFIISLTVVEDEKNSATYSLEVCTHG